MQLYVVVTDKDDAIMPLWAHCQLLVEDFTRCFLTLRSESSELFYKVTNY